MRLHYFPSIILHTRQDRQDLPHDWDPAREARQVISEASRHISPANDVLLTFLRTLDETLEYLPVIIKTIVSLHYRPAL